MVSSTMSDISSWDDCNSSQTSWDMMSDAGQNNHLHSSNRSNINNNNTRTRSGSNASACSVGMLADLDAFNINDDNIVNGGNGGSAAAAAQEATDDLNSNDGTHLSDNDLISIASRTSTVTTCCPLTLETFRHPYYCEVDRRVYEKAAILSWVKSNGTSPLTRQLVRLDQLRPLDANDEDNESISSEMGWPRPLGAFGKTKRGGRDRSSNTTFNFKAALLEGGGGVQGEKAQILTKKRPPAFIPSNTCGRRPEKIQSVTQSLKRGSGGGGARSLLQHDEEDEDDVFYAEYEARKGSGSTLIRHHSGKLLIRAKIKHCGLLRHYRENLSAREYDSNLESIDEVTCQPNSDFGYGNEEESMW